MLQEEYPRFKHPCILHPHCIGGVLIFEIVLHSCGAFYYLVIHKITLLSGTFTSGEKHRTLTTMRDVHY